MVENRGWISKFAHILPLFEFVWIIGWEKISKLFIVCDLWYWEFSCKVLRIFDTYFGSYEFLIETTLLCCVKIHMMFELLWTIGLEKNYNNFIVEYACYFEIFGKVSWILDVYFRGCEFLIESALFRCVILVIVLICFEDLIGEKYEILM